MTGIVAARGVVEQSAWSRVVDDVAVLKTNARGQWSDEGQAVRLARTLGAGDLRTPVGVHGSCTVVLDGYVESDHRCHDACERSVVDAYLRGGEDAVARLAGDFTVVLWDVARKRLVVAVDAVGLRLPAYVWDGRTLVVASRAVALLNLRRDTRIDERYLAHLATNLRCQRPGSTAFVGIRRVLPGTVLVHENGRLVERRVNQLRLVTEPAAAAPDILAEEFWNTLHVAVRDRLRHEPGAPRVALSSGLDSLCVAAALMAATESADAYTMTSDEPDLDEGRLLRPFLSRHAALRWHGVDCTDANDLFRVSARTPLTDDPDVAAPGFREARYRLHVAMAGNGWVLDGEGGDELFELFTSVSDLFSQNVCAAIRYLRVQPAPRSVIMRHVIVPHSPRLLRRPWFRRELRTRDPFPPWMSAEFRAASATQEAVEDVCEVSLKRSFAACAREFLEGAADVGERQARRLLRAAFGLESSSPLLDRRVIEFAARLPAEHRLDPCRPRAFVRRACFGVLPDGLLNRTKDLRLYEMLEARGLDGAATDAVVTALSSSPRFSALVDVVQLRRAISRVRRRLPFPKDRLRQLHALLETFVWYTRIEGRYGVT